MSQRVEVRISVKPVDGHLPCSIEIIVIHRHRPLDEGRGSLLQSGEIRIVQNTSAQVEQQERGVEELSRLFSDTCTGLKFRNLGSVLKDLKIGIFDGEGRIREIGLDLEKEPYLRRWFCFCVNQVDADIRVSWFKTALTPDHEQHDQECGQRGQVS